MKKTREQKIKWGRHAVTMLIWDIRRPNQLLSLRRKNREGEKIWETQQFFPLPIATYMAQMVFVKTSEYFWSNQKLSGWSQSGFSFLKQKRRKPASGSLVLRPLNQARDSGLCQRPTPSRSTLERTIALQYQNICVTGEGEMVNGRNSRSFETVSWWHNYTAERQRKTLVRRMRRNNKEPAAAQ